MKKILNSSNLTHTLIIIGSLCVIALYSLVITPTAIAATTPTMKTMAWIYPGAPACDAETEFTDGRNIDVLKAEFFTIQSGKLTMLTSGCNAFSKENVAQLKDYSTEQFVTVSAADPKGMNTFMVRAMRAPQADVTKLVNFVVSNNLTGIELDFEGFGTWTPTIYNNYKSFVTVLGNALHAKGKKLMIDGPAVSNAREEANWYLWRYADFVNLPVDHMVVMAYDYQYDYAAGAPVAPLAWLKDVTTYVSSKYPKDKITIGLPSYGYQGTKGEYDIKILTREQISKLPGYQTAKRDVASGEMAWQIGNQAYFYQDATSLQMKSDAVQNLGITSVSVWHLGGNSWF